MEYLNFPEKEVRNELELVSPPLVKIKKGRQKRRLRQEQLLKEYFSHQVNDFYEEKKVGDKWYVKMYNGGNDNWQVAIFSSQSFRNYKGFTGGN